MVVSDLAFAALVLQTSDASGVPPSVVVRSSFPEVLDLGARSRQAKWQDLRLLGVDFGSISNWYEFWSS